MNFLVFFVNYAQKNRGENMEVKKKSTDAQIRATKKYSNSKWRPNIYLDMNRRKEIEEHFRNKGHKTFNEYIIALIDKDMIL